MKTKIFVIAVVWLFSGFLSSAQAQTKPCECADKQDLLNALSNSQMAIEVLNNQLKSLEDREESSSEKIETFTDKGHAELSKSLDAALGKGEAGYFSVLDMNPRDCSLIEKGTQNECARQIEKSLIDVFKKACDETKNLPLNENPYRQMKPVIQHYISAYQAMQDFILQMLRSLPKNCRPNGWFGYIVYQKVQTDVSVLTVPPDLRGELARYGGTQTLGTKSTYIGTVLVEDGKAVSARGYATHSEDKSSMSSQQMLCNTSDGIVTTVDTNTLKLFTEGGGKGDVRFDLKVHPANKTYDLYAQQFPTVNTTGKEVRSSKSTYPGKARNCGGHESNHTQAKTIPISGPGHFVTDEKIKSADYLEGSRIVKPPEFNVSVQEKNESYTKTFEIQFKWMLRRLPQK